MKREGRKIILALLLNFFLIGVGLFILDTLKIISIGQVLESLGLRKGYVPKIEDPNLLEKAEMKKTVEIAGSERDGTKEDCRFFKKERTGAERSQR